MTDLFRSHLEKFPVAQGFGLEPNSAPVKDLVALNGRKEIIVARDQTTNISGFFAAGDVTDIPDKQIAIAMGDGAKAALAAHKYLVTHELTKSRIGLKEEWQ